VLTATQPTAAARLLNRIRFDRNEWAGSFGDIGTDLPLILGMIAAAGLEGSAVFFIFGLMQILTGIVYGLPMPMQPLKAMAVIVITQKIAATTIFGAGIAIGVMMLILTISGLLQRIARLIPLCVVRGIQFGLGLSLATLALRQYVPAGGPEGFVLAVVAVALMTVLWKNRRIPAGLLVVALGAAYVALTRGMFENTKLNISTGISTLHITKPADILTGLFVLALPQLPLSLTNSVIATQQTCKDLFPERKVTITKIGMTYSLVNLVIPFFGGIPVCHGCGGLAGHYGLGARTGGSVIIYGSMFVLVAVLFGSTFNGFFTFFPLSILGSILLFESFNLVLFMRDQMDNRRNLMIASGVALIAYLVPQGYIIGMLAGTVIYYLPRCKIFGAP
jgi:hypothetical protein